MPSPGLHVFVLPTVYAYEEVSVTTSKSLFIFANVMLTTVLLVSTVGAQGSAGTITSPNGRFTIAVTDSGIALVGPNAKINLGANTIVIDGPSSKISVMPGTVNIQAAGPVKINGTAVQLNGLMQLNGTVQLNGACKPLALGQGFVKVEGAGTYPVLGQGLADRVFGC